MCGGGDASPYKKMIEIGKHIEGIEPYKPGKPLEELERELGIKDAIKLASNENPLGPSRKALRVLKKGLDALHRYPEGTGRLLREAIARKNKISPDGVILGNGSDEIMDLAAKVFLSPGEEAIVGDRTFAIYSISVRAHGGRVREVPLKEGVHDLEAMRRASPSTSRTPRSDSAAVAISRRWFSASWRRLWMSASSCFSLTALAWRPGRA